MKTGPNFLYRLVVSAEDEITVVVSICMAVVLSVFAVMVVVIGSGVVDGVVWVVGGKDVVTFMGGFVSGSGKRWSKKKTKRIRCVYYMYE